MLDHTWSPCFTPGMNQVQQYKSRIKAFGRHGSENQKFKHVLYCFRPAWDTWEPVSKIEGRGEVVRTRTLVAIPLRFNKLNLFLTLGKQTPLEILCSLLLRQQEGYQKIKGEHHRSLQWAEYRSLRSTGISPLTVLLSAGILRTWGHSLYQQPRPQYT